jgi:hypothetical protein
MDHAKSSYGESFSPDYNTARLRFQAAAARAGGRIDSLEIGAKGPDGEGLTIDIAWFGGQRPRRVFVHSSGLHGVEGFAGSAIQLQWLTQKTPSPPEHDAIVMVHILNPYGMAWLRRVNENNVDLNRNFLGPEDRFEGAPPGFFRLDNFLNPSTPPSKDLFHLRAGWLIARYGLRPLKQAVAGGQCVNPKGLFFGGERLEEGPRLFQAYVAERLRDVKRLVVIDIHTGLGRFGDDRLLAEASPNEVFSGVKRAFGDRVQPLDVNRGVAFQVRGGQNTMYSRLMAEDSVYFAAQEFGTYNSLAVLAALRSENRWHHYGGGTVDHPAKRRLREVFGPDSERWRKAVLQRGSEVISQATALAFEDGDAKFRRAP